MANDTQDGETGRFASKYAEADFIGALNTLGETGTPEVAAEVGCDYDTALRRLTALADQGAIDRRRVAGTLLWGHSARSGAKA